MSLSGAQRSYTGSIGCDILRERMPAEKTYYWDVISPGVTASVYVYGWPPGLFVVFSATPFVYSNPAQPPDIFLSQGKVDVDGGGTVARTASVQNNGFQPCVVQLNSFFEDVVEQ
jgi:hypothetical protein